MVYLDNAATSFPKPQCVINDLTICLKKYCGNPGRSSHRLAMQASEKIYECREAISKLIRNRLPEGVVFTYNATYALNLAMKSMITEKCHVIISDLEHNAVVRPLEKLSQTLGVEYSLFDSDGDLETNIKKLIRADTVGIISTLASNVTGRKLDAGILSDICKRNSLFLILDASQAIGHSEIDLCKAPCDVLCAPGHKSLFGIQGGGFAVFSDPRRKNSLIEGGSGSDSRNVLMPELLPEGYEAGTLSTPAIVSLLSGTEFVMKNTVSEIERKIVFLTNKLEERLLSFKNLTVYSAEGGIISFNYGEYPSYVISEELDRFGICTRAGLHCAPSAHCKLGTLDRGTVRLSLSCLNSERDVDVFYKAMKKISFSL